ncbi:STAS domain-containing protein [Pleionea sp. CnH1-48]|uniref:STAS domain-containing protein n=1 Tax=Pleionea sp. CnH1-48 TaxID=2954494 RepID=UPI002097AE5A|nr:STAS domain-containing protein [Pleionea sp. CnH1-48]MCO7226985.1 STAS domain-containing protein [Pleionea sp. CnH1-48]
MSSLDIAFDDSEKYLMVNLSGQLDATTSVRLQTALEEKIAASSQFLIIDAKELSYISSAGLRVLLMVVKKVEPLKGKLAMCHVKEGVSSIIRMVGFDRFIAVHDDKEQAIQTINQAIESA